MWSSLTTRALALAVVLLVLTISYASSLRIYFDQRRGIAETRIEIAQRKQAISDLDHEIARWNDPAFVRSQARERLGWVVPGETGYKVIGADGKPVGGGAEIDQQNKPAQTKTEAWWARLFGSIKIADHPVSTDQDARTPTDDRTVGPESPSPSPSKPR
jgi:cell division protein FtsB